MILDVINDHNLVSDIPQLSDGVLLFLVDLHGILVDDKFDLLSWLIHPQVDTCSCSMAGATFLGLYLNLKPLLIEFCHETVQDNSSSLSDSEGRGDQRAR